MMSPLATIQIAIAALAAATAYAAPLDATSFLQTWAGQSPEDAPDPSYIADMLKRVREESKMMAPPHTVGYRVPYAGTQGGLADLPPPSAWGGRIPFAGGKRVDLAAAPPPTAPPGPGGYVPGTEAQGDVATVAAPDAPVGYDAVPGMEAQGDVANAATPVAPGDAAPGMDVQGDLANAALPAASGGHFPSMDAQAGLDGPFAPSASGDQAPGGDAQIDLASAPPPDGSGDGDLNMDDLPVDLGEYNVTEWSMAAPRATPPTAQAVPAPGEVAQIQSEGEGEGEGYQQATPNKGNLCMFNRFVPEFILIGVMKAATTTFAAEMRLSKSIMFPFGCFSKEKGEGFCERGTGKEAHFFDTNRQFGPKSMAMRFPPCRQDTRMVGTDESPRYLVDPTVPKTIANWYGDDRLKLTFMILLRDPVERFHSDYYHAKEGGWCIDYKTMSFATIVHRITHGHWDEYTGGQYGCHQRLEASLYPTSINRWFKVFAPRQFTIAPFKYVVDPGNETRPAISLVETVWNRLGVVPGPARMDAHFNRRNHRSLAEDLSELQYTLFRSMIWHDNSPMHLAMLLSRQPGAVLHGYEGLFNDVTKIEEWLINNW